MSRVLVLGGGFGGISAAVSLREQLGSKDEVVLVDRRTHFLVGFRKTWCLLGAAPIDDGRRPLAGLAAHGIRVIQGDVTAIHPAERRAEVDGRSMEADALVVGLGAARAVDAVPGFREHAINVYDPDAISAGAEALSGFAGGRVTIAMFGAPYPCPPAPFELALLLSEFFERRKVAARIEVVSPQPMSLPILGQAGCSAIDARLAERGIDFLPNHQPSAVLDGEIAFGEERRPFDLLLGVPVHRCPPVVLESGLTDGGAWVRVDARTLETRFPGVYAVGDVTAIPLANGQMLPKAGVFAAAEGRVVAARIAAVLDGRPATDTFGGEGSCFLEMGGGQASMVRGRFLADPPAVELTEPSPDHLAAKVAFEADHLRAWFGG